MRRFAFECSGGIYRYTKRIVKLFNTSQAGGEHDVL